jgi:hypothetical protein
MTSLFWVCFTHLRNFDLGECPYGQGECYRQNHPDRTNLRTLNFADNKDLHGGKLSESLTSVPVIDGTQLEMKIKHDPAPTLLQQCVPMHFRFQTPIGYKIIFFACPLILLLLPLVITFLPHCHSFLLHDDKRTNERTNERTNGNSPLLTSCSSFAYHY